MLTAKDGEWDEAEALDTGADDFLSKPFSFVVLVARLRALLRARRAAAAGGARGRRPRARPGHAASASAATPRSSSTAREFALLEHLMRQPTRSSSKRELLDQVWGIDLDGDPNVVEVYVGYLRRRSTPPSSATAW